MLNMEVPMAALDMIDIEPSTMAGLCKLNLQHMKAQERPNTEE